MVKIMDMEIWAFLEIERVKSLEPGILRRGPRSGASPS